jgi:hypothetical protein
MFTAASATVDAMPQRLTVIATAAVTWLTLAGTIAAVLIDELAGFPTAVDIIARAGVVIATAATIIRRVTPVADNERGII